MQRKRRTFTQKMGGTLQFLSEISVLQLKNIKFMTNVKNIEKTIAKINSINKLVGNIELEFADGEKCLGTLDKHEKKGFLIEFNTHQHRERELKGIKFVNNNIELYGNMFITKVSFDTSLLPRGKKCHAIVDQLFTTVFDAAEKGYQRLVIPTKKAMDFHYIFETIPYENSSYITARSRFILSDSKSMGADIYAKTLPKTEQQYLFIDSLKPCAQDEFAEYCFCCLIGLGFFTGYFLQDEGYFCTLDTDCNEIYRI